KPFSRCAGEGLIPNLAARDGEEALLPFTGEGARRADEGARAQRSVLLMLSGRARAARFARALIRRCAARHLLPLRRRRALSGRCGRDLTEEPFSRSREKVPGGRMRGRERSEACF